MMKKKVSTERQDETLDETQDETLMTAVVVLMMTREKLASP